MFHLILKNLDEAYILINTKFELLFFNEKAAEFFRKYRNGKTPKTGESIFQYTIPDFKERLQKLLTDVLTGNEHKILRTLSNEYETEVFEMTLRPLMEDNECMGILIHYSNITNQYNIQQELQRNNLRYELAVQVSGDIIWEASMKTRVVFLPAEFTKLTGYTNSEVPTLDVLLQKVIHADDRKMFLESILKYLNSNSEYNDIPAYRYVAKDGTILHVKMRAKALRDKEGKIDKVIGITSNITQSYLLQEELRRSNERYEMAALASQDFFWELDIEKDLLYFNPENLKKIFGYEFRSPMLMDEYLKKTRTPQTCDEMQRFRQNIKNTGVTVIEYPVQLAVKSDGTIIYIKGSAIARKNRDGKMIKLYGSTRNITNSYLSDEALRLSNERFELAALASYDTFWERNFAKNTYTFSKSFKQNFGHDYEQEWPIKQFKELVLHPDDREMIHSFAKENYKKQRTLFQYPVHRYIRKNGSVAYVDVRCISQYNTEGKPVKTVGVIRDITDIHTMQQYLQQSNERFTLASLASYDLIWDIDMASGIISYSEAIHTLWGYNVSEPMNIWDFLKIFIYPDDFNMLVEAFKIFMKSSDTQKEMPVHRVITKDGSIAYIQVRAMAIRKEDGYITRMVGVSRDITTQYLNELELRKTNERYKLASETSYDLIWDFDMLTETIENSEILNVPFGYNLSGPMKIFDFLKIIVYPDDFPKVAASFSNFVNSKKIKHEFPIYRILRKDRSIGYVQVRAMAIRNENGQVIRMLGVTRDITIQHLSELELRKTNQRYEQVAAINFDLILEVDILSGKMFVSEVFKSFYGYDINDFKTAEDTYQKLIHPADFPRVMNEIFSNRGSKIDITDYPVFRLVKKNGEIVYCNAKAIFTRNEKGEPIRSLAVVRNITESYLAEQEIKRMNERYELAAKASFDMLWERDFSTDNYYFSEALRRNFGYDHNEKWTVEKFRSTLIHPEDRNRTVQYIDDCYARKMERFRTPVHRYVKKDGSIAYVDVFSYVVYNKEGKPARTIGVTRNITSQHLLEKQLTEANQRYELVAKATSDAVWEWNYKTGKVIFWNEGIKNLFGYDIEGREVDLEWWSDKIDQQDADATLSTIDKAIKKRKNTFRTEYRFITADDYHAHVMDRGYISYDANGVPDIITGSMQDITEVKHLEEKIIEDAIRHQRQITELTIQTQEKEREELGRELHDNINQILAATKLSLEIAKGDESLKDVLLEKSYENVNNAIKEIRMLSKRLISPVLDMGLKEAIRHLVDNMSGAADLKIIYQPGKGDFSFFSKPLQLMLYRIVQEQINNILKHAKASQIKIKIGISNNSLKLSVQDNGIGFDVNQNSSGVGLRNIKSRAKLYNGTATITSSPGKGCSLEISIPLNN